MKKCQNTDFLADAVDSVNVIAVGILELAPPRSAKRNILKVHFGITCNALRFYL
jgi:hypothetical protein